MSESGPICSIPDCGGKPVGRGWCARHYGIWRTYGDPLHPVRRYVRQSAQCGHVGCPNKPKRRGLCEKHAKREDVHGETTDPRERRFWAKVDRRGNDECWPWTGQIQWNGYGQFGGNGNGTRLAHRIAYAYTFGEIPPGMVLDHVCHTRDRACRETSDCAHRRCCNPSHLQPLPQRENIARGNGGTSWGYVPEPIQAQIKPPTPENCTECDGDKPIYKRTLCRPCYRKWLKDPNVERPSQRTPEQRFWEKVEKTGSCWLWIASINAKTGYGRFAPKHGQPVDAHRFSYLLAHGSIPGGFDVHHTCHVRRCVRPEHLRATSRAENLAERKVRRP